jgi:ribonuclease HII
MSAEVPWKEWKFSDRAEAEKYFQSLCNSGFKSIAGVDEVGRGPVAGPVVSACVLLPPNHGIVGIRDSKKLSPKRREELSDQIIEVAYYGIGVRENDEVDAINIHRATHRAATDAVLHCLLSGAPIDFVLCDGSLNLSEVVPVQSSAVIKGDLWFECIGAASIVAKVYHDHQMAVYDGLWPEYGFATNQGYGTKAHLAAIKKYGITPIHRRTFGICRGAKERETNVQGSTGEST